MQYWQTAYMVSGSTEGRLAVVEEESGKRVAAGAAWLDRHEPGWRERVTSPVQVVGFTHVDILDQVYRGRVQAQNLEFGEDVIWAQARLWYGLDPDDMGDSKQQWLGFKRQRGFAAWSRNTLLTEMWRGPWPADIAVAWARLLGTEVAVFDVRHQPHPGMLQPA